MAIIIKIISPRIKIPSLCPAWVSMRSVRLLLFGPGVAVETPRAVMKCADRINKLNKPAFNTINRRRILFFIVISSDRVIKFHPSIS